MAENATRQSWVKKLTAVFIGSALFTAMKNWKWVLARQILARIVGGVVAWLLITGVIDRYFFPSCLHGVKFLSETPISDSMRYNWETSPLAWLRVKAVNRCDERISFEVTCEVRRAQQQGRDVGIPCLPQPPEPYTFHVEPNEPLLEEFDPPLDFDVSNWEPTDPQDSVLLYLNLQVVDKSERRHAGSALGVLLGTRRDEGVENHHVQVELRPRTNYLWRMEQNPRDAALASLAVWARRPRAEAADLAGQLSLQDSLDEWMGRTYDRVFAEVEVQSGADELPPNTRNVIIDPPENVLASGRGSPIETGLVFAALASRVVDSQSRNDRIILMMAPASDDGPHSMILVAWATGERPRSLRAFSVSGTRRDFQAATADADRHLENLPLDRILDGLEDDGVYVDTNDDRLAALDVRRAWDRYGLSGGLP